MRPAKGQAGLTLIELIISLAIAALILPLVAGIVFMLQFFPGRATADIQAQQNLQVLGQWVTIDGNRADGFSAPTEEEDEYGIFSWTEYGGTLPIAIEVTYLYDGDTTSLVRRVTRNGVLDRNFVVAQNIASAEDVIFESDAPAFERDPSTGLFHFSPGRVIVRPTTTVEKVGVEPAILTSTVIAELRTQFTGAMATPEATPTPVPAPAGNWFSLADTTGGVGAGGALTVFESSLYALEGGGRTAFGSTTSETGSGATWMKLPRA